ncbi:hypothetical protein [Flavobacterium nackdongense]|uniref:Long-chain fatty acid transport protein n=1 Tax=Flavobacterium nackdongense TaxID=2547394 RepID=A0A4P6Y9Y3_9FLAO|nr:hypothetical protein [Flavobacterium nackdongense]QBN18888.1 hypothetical protein E1750_08755 [Flavobacterium nackdongense]
MIKNFLISSCLLLSLLSFSQAGTSSPYSFYGIGEAKFNGNVESRSMGGISMIPDSTRINFQNPAGFANLKWTNFAIAASTDYKKQKSGSSDAVTRRTTLDYIALAVPLGKFGAGFGLIPYSSVGYNIENIYDDGSQNSKRFNGWGGMNRVFLGTGYRIMPNLSIGATAYYNFGKINTNSVEFIPFVPVGSRELNVTTLSGLNLNFGLMYQYKLKDKLTLFSSFYYTPKSILVSNNERTIGTVTINSSYDYSSVDSYDSVTTKKDLNLPQKWALGFGIGDAKKWVFGADFAVQDVGKLYNTYNTLDNVTYSKYQRYGFGGYFTPTVNPFFSYAKRITYRAGFVYEKTGLIVNSTSINDVGMTLGAGLPITGSLTNLNLGLQFGKKGTTSNNLVQENYIILNLGFSLNDKWFVKSKYR